MKQKSTYAPQSPLPPRAAEAIQGEILPPAQVPVVPPPTSVARSEYSDEIDGGAMTIADLPQGDQDRIQRFQSASRSENTSRAYRSQVRAFESWAKAHGLAITLPISPAIVAAYLTERADAGASRSTLSVALAAIKAAHVVEKHRFDAADPVLVSSLAGARRLAVREQKQAAPLRPVVLAGVLASLGDGHQDRRDATLLSLAYMLALRRSELAAIDYETRGDGLGVLRMIDDGLELVLLRSKTSQDGSVRIAIERDHNPRGFAALERWITHAEIKPGEPLIRRILPYGAGIGGRISEDGINVAIKDCVRRYYLSTGADAATADRLASRYSGHSGRVGFIVAAKETGASDSDVAVTSRHKSLSMIQRYGQQAEQKRRAPHRLPGVGL